MRNAFMGLAFLGGIALGTLGGICPAQAHCDTMAGPVVTEALAALQKGEATSVLKWVRKEDEDEVKKAFREALKAGKPGTKAGERARKGFLETLVRLHRVSEGEPFAGLKPADTPLEPGVRESDEAIAKGSVEEVTADLSGKLSQAIRTKFRRLQEAKKHEGESVEKGREYVAAYVDFVHTVEQLHALLGEGGGHGHPTSLSGHLHEKE